MKRKQGTIIQHLSKLAFALALVVVPSVTAAKPAGIVKQQMLKPDVEVRRIPITGDSKPFLASSVDLAARGYVEEEFFISGTARTYEWVGNSNNIRSVTSPGPYTTRILVIRPADPKRFSGNVEVEALNASLGSDFSTTTATAIEYITRRGDAWVGVTSKPLALNALKGFNPVRYADLAWSNPMPVADRCNNPSIISMYSFGSPELAAMVIKMGLSRPESEDGLIYDIYAQLGTLLKSEQRQMILPGFAKPRLFSTGASQSGLIQRTFVTGFHKIMRLPGNKPIFDGYLIEVGPAMLRINQCSPDVMPTDPRNKLPIVDVPVIDQVSEGDMWLGLPTRAPDVARPHYGHLTYEVAGASHGPGAPFRQNPPGSESQNDFPRGYLMMAALRNLQDWTIKGIIPPKVAPLEIKDGEIARDANGNALGGVRSPWIDVPIASHQGALGLGPKAVVGKRMPFSEEKLRSLYPTSTTYIDLMEASFQKAVAARLLLAEDHDAIMDVARKAASAWDAAAK